MQFRAPYRIIRVYDKLKARPELADCDITIEELDADREEGYFPVIQFDTARVFVRRGTFSINVLGRLDTGVFTYVANVYDGNTPAGDQYWAKIDHLDEMIEKVVSRFVERK